MTLAFAVGIPLDNVLQRLLRYFQFRLEARYFSFQRIDVVRRCFEREIRLAHLAVELALVFHANTLMPSLCSFGAYFERKSTKNLHNNMPWRFFAMPAKKTTLVGMGGMVAAY